MSKFIPDLHRLEIECCTESQSLLALRLRFGVKPKDSPILFDVVNNNYIVRLPTGAVAEQLDLIDTCHALIKRIKWHITLQCHSVAQYGANPGAGIVIGNINVQGPLRPGSNGLVIDDGRPIGQAVITGCAGQHLDRVLAVPLG